ncbi:MAG: leucine-rich repeat protein [Lachnospiraceae bacterium]|jgi:hypothetical protein|nr:leucine-rich repeat protein [Lachnospiraceae bacterium]
MAVFLSAALLVPASTVSAAELPGAGQLEELSGENQAANERLKDISQEESAAGNQEGIKEGVLRNANSDGTEEGGNGDGTEEGGNGDDTEEGGSGNEGTGTEAQDFVVDENGVLTEYKGAGGELTIPAKVGEIDVTGIAEKIFDEKKQELTKVIISAGITEIPRELFKGCANLEEVVFPETLTGIGLYSFAECGKLTGVEFPEGLKTIGTHAFVDCGNLEEAVFPETLTEIGSYAFARCKKLLAVELPGKLEKIDMGVFSECASLKSIQIPSSVTNVAFWAFYNCTSLESLIFQKGETTGKRYLEGDAFEGCSSLKEVELPAEMELKAGNVFSKCTSLTEFKVAEGSAYLVLEGCLYQRWDTELMLVACPAGKTEVKFPEGITNIGGASFGGCTNLISVEIPDTVKTVSNGAFDSCTGLKKVVLPPDLSEISSYLFRDTALTEIKIPETVNNIGSYAFYGCKELKTVTIPGKAYSVGEHAFEGCTGLESVYLQEGVEHIYSQAFRGCSSLKTWVIPESVTLIDYDAIWSEDTANLTIYGKEGSEAENFARNNNINFSTEQPPQPPSTEEPEGEIYDISNAAFIVTLEAEVYDYDGTGKRPVVTVKKGEEELLRGTDFTVEYKDNVNPGTAKAIVRGADKYSGEVTKEFTIEASKDISSQGFTVTLSETEYTYDGKAKEPAVTVTKGTEKLRGTDFTVKYENNINPGTAKAIVTGAGGYTGTVTKEFTIKEAKKKNIDLTCKKVFTKKYGDKAFSLQAKAVKGAKITYKTSDKKVADVDKKGKVAIKGTGIATITIKATASGYDDKSLKVTVKVSPSKASAPSLKTLRGRKLKVSWKKDSRATGYQIQYCTSKAFKKGVKTITISRNKTITRTISKLTKGKRYYVRVRAYKSVKVNKKTQKLYGAWSSVKRSGKIRK